MRTTTAPRPSDGSRQSLSKAVLRLRVHISGTSVNLRLNQWNLWLGKSVNRRIFAAMLTVGGLSLVVKTISTLKEIVIAHQFGVGDDLDAFLIAYLLPSFAINVVAGSFNAAVIPTYAQITEEEGKDAAQRLFSSLMVWGACLLIGFSFMLGIASSFILPVLGSGFGPEKLALTQTLFLIVLPTLPLSGMFVMWAAVLNARERFALVAATPALTPVVVICMVYGWGGPCGVYSFAVAIVVGAAFEGSLMMGALKRQGISLIPRWYGMTPPLKQVMKQYVPVAAASLMMCGTGLVDQSMAAMLGPGSVSVLNYGNKFSAVVVTIGAMAVSTSVLPQFSRMIVAGVWESVRGTIKTYTRVLLFTTVPISLTMILTSQPLVSLLFEKGAFTASDAIQVASVQSLYILQLPFHVGGMVFVRLISALNENQILMWGTAISFVLNIILDYVLMKSLGVSGIALSTSVVYLVSFFYLWGMSLRLLSKRCNRLGLREMKAEDLLRQYSVCPKKI